MRSGLGALHSTYRKEAVAIFFFGLCCFLLSNNHDEFVNFQSRFALFTADMRRFGISFFPTIYGKLYPDYTALSTLFMYFFASVFGGLSVFVAVLPTAIVSSITLVITYLIVVPLSRTWAIFSVFFLLLTLAFFSEARSISIDQYVCTITCAVFYFCYAYFDQRSKKHFLLLLLFLFLGFAVRGPVGFIIPFGVTLMYFLLDKKYVCCFKVFLWGGVFFLFCVLLFFFLTYMQGGIDFLKKVLSMQVTSRIAYHERAPYFFYFTSLIKNFSISSVLSISTLLGCGFFIYKNRSDKKNRLVILLVGWVLVIMVGMSIPGDKKTRYILPVAPALSIIGAYLFMARRHNLLTEILIRLLRGLFFLLPSVGLLVLMAAVLWSSGSVATFISRSYNQILLAVSLLIFLQILSFFYLKKNALRKQIGLAFCAFFVFYVLIVEPGIYYLNGARKFVLTIEKLRNVHRSPVVFYKIDKDAGAIKYFVNVQSQVEARFITMPQQLLELRRNDYVVMSYQDFRALSSSVKKKFLVVEQGSFGRINAVALWCR